MTVSDVLGKAEGDMKKALDHLAKEFHTIRTGRANPAILDRVEADYYGTPTALKQLANLSVQEGRTIVIQPYDKSVLKAIEKAINESDLGMAPNSDGNVIRLTVPPLTEERRKEMVKIVKKYAEEARVAIRNDRRNALEELKKQKGTLSDDEIKRQEENLQKTTDKYIKEVDKMTTAKEAEVMEV